MKYATTPRLLKHRATRTAATWLLALAGATHTLAQPTPDTTTPATESVDAAPATPMDEPTVRRLVNEEVARILEARAAAASEPAAPAATPVDGPSGANGFMDVRLSFTLTNENILAKPGETIPSVPGWRFGRPNSLGTLFFDNYDTRFSGYETLSHAVLYKKMRKDHVEAEAGLVLRINELSERRIDLSDAGSYINIAWWKDPTHTDKTRLTLTAFPVSADRMRLGYSYRLSWGGNDEWKGDSTARPGLRLQFDNGKMYAFVGAKSAITLDKTTAEQEAKLSVLAGAGADVTEMVRVEANGGYFNRGSNELPGVDDQDVEMIGASAQVSMHKGMPLQSSNDYKLYRYTPENLMQVFKKPVYTDGLSWLAMAEFTAISQTLKDPTTTDSTVRQLGLAGDLNVRANWGRTRFRADVSMRDLAFLLHTVPSLPAYQDFAPDYETAPNLFAAFGADHNWHDRLTVGVVIGVDQPATLTTPSALPGVPTLGTSTAVVRLNQLTNSLLVTILPEGESAVPAVATKLSAVYQVTDMFDALLDAYYVYDANTARLVRNGPEDTLSFAFGEFNQLGVNLTLRTTF